MKTLISDLGGVLLYFSHQRMCEQLASLCQVPTEKVTELLFEGPIADQMERGMLSNEELLLLFQKLSGRTLPMDGLLHAASDIFSPNYEMITWVQTLKTQGVRLVLLSNTCSPHFEFARKTYPFLENFDTHILSYEIGARKPEPKIFLAALAAAHSPPEECLYIDDVADYTATAQTLGIPSYTFKDLASLQKWLDQATINR